jgi:hypothetical protein
VVEQDVFARCAREEGSFVVALEECEHGPGAVCKRGMPCSGRDARAVSKFCKSKGTPRVGESVAAALEGGF